MPISNPSRTPQSPSVDVTISNVKASSFNSSTLEVTTTQTIEIVPANLNRQSLTIFNRGENIALIDVFSTEPENYMFPLEPGGFYEMPGYGIYTGRLQALAHPSLPGVTAILEIREFTI
jgi:hypothetical protein